MNSVDAPETFLDADQRFHGLLLQSSRNGMFLRLRSIIDEALRDRAHALQHHGSARTHDAVLHRQVARAVADRDGARAAAATREIVELTVSVG